MKSISKHETSKSRSRGLIAFGRAVLAVAAIGGMLLATPPSPAWAKPKADNNKFIPKEEENSDVAAYFIIVVSIMLGMTAVCRKNYRTADPKRSSSEL
jgi:hypothetical protein